MDWKPFIILRIYSNKSAFKIETLVIYIGILIYNLSFKVISRFTDFISVLIEEVLFVTQELRRCIKWSWESSEVIQIVHYLSSAIWYWLDMTLMLIVSIQWIDRSVLNQWDRKCCLMVVFPLNTDEVDFLGCVADFHFSLKQNYSFQFPALFIVPVQKANFTF